MKPILVLMHNALRLDDHPALSKAAESGAPVVPLYILDDDGAGQWKLGGARRWWVRQSLEALQKSLGALGSALVLRTGDFTEQVTAVAEATGAGAVYLTRGYSPTERKQEEALRGWCESMSVECRRFAGNLLIEPEHVRNKTGGVYEVFSPFWRRACELIDATEPLPAPEALKAPAVWPESARIEDLRLDPEPAHWAESLAAFWTPGEAAAHDRLHAFLEGPSPNYKADRDKPGVDATSRLSPYIANGEISPRRIWFEGHKKMADHPAGRKGVDWFLREVGWREFSNHLLFHFPALPEQPLKPRFADFPWREGHDAVVGAWQKGQTGYPIIDAGMRQLWQIGWMHNRVRMIVASFLVKDMLWHWRTGEDWFWDTLVDADLANNSASWQWVAGCGADAAPYFRIFNPVTQGEKFDPDGDYIRTYVPELAEMPNDYIHKPFEAPAGVLALAGVKLGDTYPKPVLDRKPARERALAALAEIKQAS